MGMWTHASIEALTYTNKHISVKEILKDITKGEDYVIEHYSSNGANFSLTNHLLEFRVECEGVKALAFLRKLSDKLNEVTIKSSITIHHLVLY